MSLGGLKLFELGGISGRFVRIELHASDTGACVRHFPKSGFFEIGRPETVLTRFGIKICAPLIDILHLGPALIDALLQIDQPIVTAAQTEPSKDATKSRMTTRPPQPSANLFIGFRVVVMNRSRKRVGKSTRITRSPVLSGRKSVAKMGVGKSRVGRRLAHNHCIQDGIINRR